MSSDPPKVFLSYSHKDETLKKRVETHLGVLGERLAIWQDRRLKAGEDWLAEITQAIESAQVAVLLISADFLTSDFIRSVEVPRLLERRRAAGMDVVPVLLKPCAWDQIPWLAEMQIRPTGAKPLSASKVPQREAALAEIAKEILRLAENGARPSPGPVDTHEPKYSDPGSRELSEALETAYKRHEELLTSGGDATEVLESILDLKRRLRQEGQLKPGDFLNDGRFRLLEILGRGGFSTVFKAYDKKTRRLVAVKILHTHHSQDRSRRERFFRGARKMGDLQHQGIVQVLEARAEDSGYHYFVMELVEGGDLRAAVRKGEISETSGLEILRQVAEALDFAHQRDVVHRDVKPANILLSAEGNAKLTDFDLVRALDTTGGTQTGSMLGTFLYMAPEAMERAKEAGSRADIYSLAMTAAYVLTGKELPSSVLRSPEAFFEGMDAPPEVKESLRRSAAWEPETRHGSALELWEALAEGMMSSSPASSPASPPALASASPEADETAPDESLDSAAWAHETGRDAYGPWATLEVDGVTERFRWIQPGTFPMGSPESEAGRENREGPVHTVELTEGFWLAESPCTQALWQAVMGDNPSRFQSRERPVEQVSWHDCQKFLKRLNGRLPGLDLRLPSEAEWEYACRAGTQTATWRGDLEILGARNAAALDAIAWYGGNSGVDFELSNGEGSEDWPEKQHPHTKAGTRSVAQRAANPWGLYDMLGNVWEWCRDGLRGYEAEAVKDPEGPSGGAERVVRGGSGFSVGRYVRAAYRDADEPGNRYFGLGFRLSRGPQGPRSGQGGARSAELRAPGGRKAPEVLRSGRRSRRDTAWVERLGWASDGGADQYGRWAAFETGGVSHRLRWMTPGEFLMGSPESEAGRWEDEGPQHTVTLTEGFWLGETPCTQALWQAVTGENPSQFRSAERPVESVSWEGCQAFLESLNSAVPGLAARLPTEAQWEYACRAGTQTATWVGDLQILGQRNAPVLDAIAWYGGNSGVGFDLDQGEDSTGWGEKQYPHSTAGTRVVGEKAVNPWGLRDMLGNVHEWCEDRWDLKSGYSGGPRVDPVAVDGAKRVFRGGSWSSYARIVRAAYRSAGEPGIRSFALGFRLSRGPQVQEQAQDQERAEPAETVGPPPESARRGTRREA